MRYLIVAFAALFLGFAPAHAAVPCVSLEETFLEMETDKGLAFHDTVDRGHPNPQVRRLLARIGAVGVIIFADPIFPEIRVMAYFDQYLCRIGWALLDGQTAVHVHMD